jgi:hypothetical protein
MFVESHPSKDVTLEDVLKNTQAKMANCGWPYLEGYRCGALESLQSLGFSELFVANEVLQAHKKVGRECAKVVLYLPMRQRK